MLYLSPSKISRYFYHECERHLYFSSASKEERKKQDIPDFMVENSPVTKVIMDGGVRWEETVVKKFLEGQVLIGEGPDILPISNRKLSEAATIEALQAKSYAYIYQGTFVVPDAFYTHYGIDSSRMIFSTCYPDLIQVITDEGITRFRIIDVKSSDVMKTTHKVQVALYALMLYFILQEHGIEGVVEFEAGGVWLHDTNTPSWFDMNTFMPHIDRFLKETLHQLAAKSLDDLFWHLDFRCEWCPFFEYCKDKAEQCSHISLLPYLSGFGAKFVRDNGFPLTIDGFSDMMANEESVALLSKSMSFKQRIHRLKPQLTAIREQRLVPYGSFAPDMPKGENIRIIVTAQKDPISGKIFAAAIFRLFGKELFGSTNESYIFIAQTPEECDQIGNDFISKLYDILYIVHKSNQSLTEWSDKKSVQTYVTDNYEWNNIHSLLEQLLLEPAYAEKAIQLLFHFQSELLSETDDHPENHVPFPIIVLTSVASKLFALPAHIAYRLSDLTSHLIPEKGNPFLYEPKDYTSFKVTNVMKSDLIHDVWYKEEHHKLVWIRNELQRRLWAAESIVQGIRAKAKDELGQELLYSWPNKFEFTAAMSFTYPIFSKLAFMVRYESILNYLELKNSRSLPMNEREADGITVRVKYLGGQRFELLQPAIVDELDTGSSWLLTEDNYSGEQTQASFYDYLYKDKMYTPKNAKLYYGRLEHIDHEQNMPVLTVNYGKKEDKFALHIGQTYLLSVRYTDWTSGRVLKALSQLDAMDHDLKDMLVDSESTNKSYENSFSKEHFSDVLNRANFSPSQCKAFDHMVKNLLTLVWGPPGTGKTHFIAMATLSLIELHEKQGRPLKILVSAFTHAAIENALRKIQQLQDNRDLTIVKYGDILTPNAQTLSEADDKDIVTLLGQRKSVVIGATLYQTQKAFENGFITDFDIVVLDEASQVRVPESLLALSRVKEKGHMLIVGDHYQLPPIIKGQYSVKENEPSLFTSIFEMLIQMDTLNSYTQQLTDNFRMNEALCTYPAQMIYGDKYKAFNERVALQCISLENKGSSEEWIEDALNPEFPLVLCVYEGLMESQENNAEATWVAQLTKQLRTRLKQNSGFTHPDTEDGDASFWKQGLFIISPHHVQIRAIKKQLQKTGLRPDYFVDTVDKMQGQESDVAIISYGVADPELATLEGEFIYSLNRLNVAITRAKSKTIIFLSRQLLTPTLQVLSNEKFIKGTQFMMELEKFMHNEHIKVYELNGTLLTMYRKPIILNL